MASSRLPHQPVPHTLTSLLPTISSASKTIGIWSEIGVNLQLVPSTADRPEVLAQIASLQANKEDLYKILKNSAPYISYVYAETQKQGLPAELALLPVIESEGNPNAHSKVGASGLWQFMPQTASELGIKTNQAYDGRKDIVATTHVALAYLMDLHKTFKNDWLLAMAAYNLGAGHLQTAMDHQKKWYRGASFWQLHLPAETQKYIPKVLALAAIIHDPARYGFTLPTLNNPVQLASVKVHSPAELDAAIRASGASPKTVHRLNPAYRTLATTHGAPNAFLVPILNKTFASNFRIIDNSGVIDS
jgi:membrane-bound lytic murein transglycosylase D